jgi:hypothetical protein
MAKLPQHWAARNGPSVSGIGRKYQREGRAGLALPMGRPPTSALGNFPDRIHKSICEMREVNLGWGLDRIRAEWSKDPTRKDLSRSGRSRIVALLKEEGYTWLYDRYTEPPQPEKEDVATVHEEWEMGAQGVIDGSSLGQVFIINSVDGRRRLKVRIFACLDASRSNTQDYQLTLRRAFLQYGLPKRPSLDHDSVFYDKASPSPFPNTLHLWLIGRRVDVRERPHQTLYQPAGADQTPTDGNALDVRLTERRHFLNYDFPSER